MDRPLLQGVMAAVGAAVTLAVVAIVLWEALQPPSPPVLHARVVETRPITDGFLAEIEVINHGAETAAAVDVVGRSGDAPPATATVDYVPGRGHATVWLRFDRDPRGATVEVVGWSEP